MDVREKLAELVHNARMNALWHNAQKPDEYITDMLMEDGVTVQEWIPVTERLPERFVYVLVMTDFGEAAVARVKGTGHWHIGWDNDRYDGITHWMPLPQPPKGE